MPVNDWNRVSAGTFHDFHASWITELKKVANMAEVYYVHVLPHCAIGPVAFSACMHVDAAVPNFLAQEQIDQGLGEGLLCEPWQVLESKSHRTVLDVHRALERRDIQT